MDAARAATAAADAPAIAAANAAFHRVLIDIAANPLLTAMTGPLEARVQWLFHLTKQRDPVQQCDEHEDLYQAIADHDPDRAADCAYHHVRSERELSITLAATWSTSAIDPVAATRSRRR